MQTFLPFPNNFKASAAKLDDRRLGKQRVETLQILNSLVGVRSGWRSHPALQMWLGYESALIRYGVVVCDTWLARGFKDTCREQILDHVGIVAAARDDDLRPHWLRGLLGAKVGASHRYQLYRKDPTHYWFWEDEPPTDYYWPVPMTVTPIWKLADNI
ncbi:MSMEG_6728 family protein [bacterium]|nr:MSMEG_6728 family protein [bacterium]